MTDLFSGNRSLTAMYGLDRYGMCHLIGDGFWGFRCFIGYHFCLFWHSFFSVILRLGTQIESAKIYTQYMVVTTPVFQWSDWKIITQGNRLLKWPSLNVIITITKFSNLIGYQQISALIGQCGTRHICNWTVLAIASPHLNGFFSPAAKIKILGISRVLSFKKA